jgi:hypothetical protein
MRTDFSRLKDGTHVVLYPSTHNDVYTHPVGAMFTNGFFYMHGAGINPEYTIDTVAEFFKGYRLKEAA